MDPDQIILIVVVAWFSSPLLLIFLWLRTRKKLRVINSSAEKYAAEFAQTETALQSEALAEKSKHASLAEKITAMAADHLQTKKTLTDLRIRFSKVVDADEELLTIKKKQSTEAKRHTEQILEWRKTIETLKADYGSKKLIYNRLKSEAAIFDEQIGLAELGIYTPHFQFSDSDEFKEAIAKCRKQQKGAVSQKTAVNFFDGWTVDGSKREGKKMTSQAVRLSLRAFNNECDAAIGNVRWNNITTMETRITKGFEQINKLNQSNRVDITTTYLQFKLTELRLTHEYREKQKDERDRKVEMNRLKREEERLIKDADAAQKAEDKFQKLLDKAKAEAAKAVGPSLEEYEKQIAALQHDLEIAHQKSERAKSMAEQTRAGHIYIISNIGSFGEGVYKIGMTRRLEPNDRVKELGDASVPFLFDTHAMVYSEDAPTMEKTLHAVFDGNRVNKANGRKEFFRVDLDRIAEEVAKINPDADFITGIEAQEYFETLALIEAKSAASQKTESFPDTL